jgi:hypothetical protein
MRMMCGGNSAGAVAVEPCSLPEKPKPAPGLMTSEFLLTLVAATTVVIAGYVSGALPVPWAWTLFGAIVVAYILSRGIAKAGSKEGPFVVGGRRTEQ